nr:MAG TPA: hypothetical protein [Caudoviricetes sp.]
MFFYTHREVNFCHLHPTYYISTHLLYELDL